MENAESARNLEYSIKQKTGSHRDRNQSRIMAHLIDNSKGYNAFIAAHVPAWHNLGKIFTNDITTQDALKEGGLDYEVIKLPNRHTLPSGEIIISDDSFFTLRTDVNKILGSRLGKDYTVMQNAEALDVVDEILQSGRAKIETAGVIDEGRKAFICLKVDKSIYVGGNQDEILQYVLIATSHDGTMSITATPTNIRVVCNNTLSAALGKASGAIRIRHTTNAKGKLYEAAKVLNLISTNTEANTDNYNRMKSIKIAQETMFSYFGNIFCTPDEIKQFQNGLQVNDVLSTRKQNILTEVATFANTGIGQSMTVDADGSLNMWTAYNAITGYFTGKKYRDADMRANSLLFGYTADVIQKAGQLALQPEKIKPMHKTVSKFTEFQLN